MGDFYEMFEEDALEVSQLLNLTLTKRHGVPMCGVPHHACESYIARLLKVGKKIAICDQVGLPPKGKGLAKREVVEVVTPGTVLDERYLDPKNNNYLCGLGRVGQMLSFASLDLSTGEFVAIAFPWIDRREQLKQALAKFSPREITIQESLCGDSEVEGLLGSNLRIDPLTDDFFKMDACEEALRRQFQVANMKGFGFSSGSPELLAAGAVIRYISEQKCSTFHIKTLTRLSDEGIVSLDGDTIRNLELVRNLQDGSDSFTLLDTLDFTKTALGARLLHQWILSPLTDLKSIAERHRVVENFYRNQRILSEVRRQLRGVLDLQRLTSRIASEKANAKDLLAIKESLKSAVLIDDLLLDKEEMRCLPEKKRTQILELTCFLEKAIHENPPLTLSEGRLIKEGYRPDLDELRRLRQDSQEILDRYVGEEREKTGIENLKIRYNRIVGYFFQVTKSQLSRIPDYFSRRQTLVGGERFTTDRLMELEFRLNTASERALEWERELFLEIRTQVSQSVDLLLWLSRNLAKLDCLQSFAQAATNYGYTYPLMTADLSTKLGQARHPVVEKHLPKGEFVPNELSLVVGDTAFGLVTGPNMAGKSTFLRQTALITLMAQIGSFVPAENTTMGIVDKIFCRVGASDNLARGESTFLVEMSETANILSHATERSLIIMDEVGRGTGTEEGLALAWSICEYVLNQLRSRTLFATHYHELTKIPHPRLFNLSFGAVEHEGGIAFLKKVQQGPSSSSYGIQVAGLAGLPSVVLARANELLNTLRSEIASSSPSPSQPKPEKAQRSLFNAGELLLQELYSLKLEEMTPMEVFLRVGQWQKLREKYP